MTFHLNISIILSSQEHEISAPKFQPKKKKKKKEKIARIKKSHDKRNSRKNLKNEKKKVKSCSLYLPLGEIAP